MRAIENIFKIAGDNVATVAKMTNAATSLAKQAENLAKLIAIFRVERAGTQPGKT